MTVIELGYDLRFKRQRLYIGESDEVISDQGQVTWDPSGSRIALTSEDPDTESVSYQVGENILFQLDQDGNRISGDLADRYQLSKPYFSIAEKYWQLVALEGKPVQTVEGQHTEPYILFHEKDQRFTGSGGCNRFQGGYELPGDGLITIGTVSATLMMCPDMTVEDGFSKALEQVERFTISNDTLVFYRKPKTEIARFRTVWFR